MKPHLLLKAMIHLCLLPTGYGKSICYAILPSVFDRIKSRCMLNKLQSSSPFCMHNYRVHWKYCLMH